MLFDEAGSKQMKVLQLRAAEESKGFSIRGFVAPDACWDGSAFVVAWDHDVPIKIGVRMLTGK
jgi:hypothetical protein